MTNEFGGEVYSIDEFCDMLKKGSINCCDGIGYYSMDGKEEEPSFVNFHPDVVRKIANKRQYNYVIWYNK